MPTRLNQLAAKRRNAYRSKIWGMSHTHIAAKMLRIARKHGLNVQVGTGWVRLENV